MKTNTEIRRNVWAALNALQCVKNDEDRGEIFGLLETLELVPKASPPKPYVGPLNDAGPDCNHEIDPDCFDGEIRCIHCGGWMGDAE